MLIRSIKKFHPGVERLERLELMSASGVGVEHAARAVKSGTTMIAKPSDKTEHAQHAVIASGATTDVNQKPYYGFLTYRITNPDAYNNYLEPPFPQVLVQSKQPVPGETYNVLQVSVRNGTAKTFDASDGFQVKLSGQTKATPILTGNETWKPGQVYVFYVLTHKYYPIQNTVAGGFIFNLGGARSILVPGPSAIFLRLPYKPTTFAKTLDWIVAHGPGAQGGAGLKYGLPVTSIAQFVSSRTRRNDFGGYF